MPSIQDVADQINAKLDTIKHQHLQYRWQYQSDSGCCQGYKNRRQPDKQPTQSSK